MSTRIKLNKLILFVGIFLCSSISALAENALSGIDVQQTNSFEYNVMSIPTTIIIKEGKEVDRAVGIISKDVLSQMVK